VLSKLFDDIEFSGNFGFGLFVFFRLVFTPGGLGSERSLDVFELNLVTFEGFGELSKEGLGSIDKSGKSSLLISKGLLLVFEGGQKSFPISLSLIFVGLGEFLFSDDIFSDVGQEL